MPEPLDQRLFVMIVGDVARHGVNPESEDCGHWLAYTVQAARNPHRRSSGTGRVLTTSLCGSGATEQAQALGSGEIKETKPRSERPTWGTRSQKVRNAAVGPPDRTHPSRPSSSRRSTWMQRDQRSAFIQSAGVDSVAWTSCPPKRVNSSITDHPYIQGLLVGDFRDRRPPAR